MTTLNRVVLTGKVVAPSHRHYRPDGSPVIQFLLELNETDPTPLTVMRPGRGTRINIVAIGKLAEFDLNFLQSGQQLMVIGKLSQRNWQSPEGKSRSRTEVIATKLCTVEENQRKEPKRGE